MPRRSWVFLPKYGAGAEYISPDGPRWRCAHCPKTYKAAATSGTSHISRHLEAHHKITRETVEREFDATVHQTPSLECSRQRAGREPIKQDSPSLLPSPSPSTSSPPPPKAAAGARRPVATSAAPTHVRGRRSWVYLLVNASEYRDSDGRRRWKCAHCEDRENAQTYSAENCGTTHIGNHLTNKHGVRKPVEGGSEENRNTTLRRQRPAQQIVASEITLDPAAAPPVQAARPVRIGLIRHQNFLQAQRRSRMEADAKADVLVAIERVTETMDASTQRVRGSEDKLKAAKEDARGKKEASECHSTSTHNRKSEPRTPTLTPDPPSAPESARQRDRKPLQENRTLQVRVVPKDVVRAGGSESLATGIAEVEKDMKKMHKKVTSVRKDLNNVVKELRRANTETV